MIRIILTYILYVIGLTAYAQFASVPAFPGAEGFGRYTVGGRGGKVYHVTTLDDYVDDSRYGEKSTEEEIRNKYTGTLRYALKQNGARTIVFDVAGTISLKCPLRILNDSVSVLGQTAPGDGICLSNYTFGIFANNVIVRFIRCRMGDIFRTEDDAMNAFQRHGNEKSNIIIDHCSMSWSTDECGSFYGNRMFTLQWCILAESLRNSVHDKGKHGYGGIWGGENATFHHNLLAHHDSRNPRFDHGYVSTLAGPVDYVNNVVYNWGGNSTYGGENRPGCEAKKINMINNFYKPGPYTRDSTSHSNRLIQVTTKCGNCNPSNGKDVVPGIFYITGNIVDGKPSTESSIAFDNNYTLEKLKENCMSDERFLSSAYDFGTNNILSIHDAASGYNKVLLHAGASLRRDTVDTEVCDDVRTGTARYKGNRYGTPGLIDSQNDVRGKRYSAWQELKGVAPIDSDRDGIPDAWEKKNGLNPDDASDASAYTIDTERHYYTNLEVYSNSLVESIMRSEREDSDSSFEEYFPVCF